MEKKYLVLESDLGDLRAAQNEILKKLKAIEENRTDGGGEEYMTRTRTRALLNVSNTTLHRLMNEGKIPFKKFGRSTRFLKSDVLKSLQNS